MNIVRPLTLTLSLAVAFLFGAIATAHAQSGTPQSPYVISSAPYTITQSGYYVLDRNLGYTSTSGTIIEIRANNVTLDFNGFYIAGAVGNTGQSTVGVSAFEKANVTVKNGTVAYCRYGILLQGDGSTNTNAVGDLVDNMRVTYCYSNGIAVQFCPAARVQNCQISQTGYSGATYANAIDATASGATILNNTINNVTASTAYGIFAPGSIVRQNSIINAAIGVNGGKYQDNLTLGCTTPFANGIDAGGNN